MERSSRRLRAIRSCALLTLTVLALVPSGAAAKQPSPVLPPTAHPHGLSYSAWAAEWWQWALGQPADVNPLVDTTGANCAEGQNAKVWFLAGTIMSGEEVERDCTLPVGTTLLFPVLNEFACADPGQTLDDLRGIVGDIETDPTEMTAVIDGVAVRNVAAYYEESEVFSLQLPEDNILGAPPGTYEPCVDAGYYLAVRPLPPGEHTIHLTGSRPGFDLDVTYNITVARPSR
jgi:hypothetical protein